MNDQWLVFKPLKSRACWRFGGKANVQMHGQTPCAHLLDVLCGSTYAFEHTHRHTANIVHGMYICMHQLKNLETKADYWTLHMLLHTLEATLWRFWTLHVVHVSAAFSM